MKIINKKNKVKDLSKKKQYQYRKYYKILIGRGLEASKLNTILKNSTDTANTAYEKELKRMMMAVEKDDIRIKEQEIKDLKTSYKSGKFKGNRKGYNLQKKRLERELLQLKIDYTSKYSNPKTNINHNKNVLKLATIDYELEKQRLEDKKTKAKTKTTIKKYEQQLLQLEREFNKKSEKLEQNIEKAKIAKQANNEKGLNKIRENVFGFKLTVKEIKEFQKEQKKANGNLATEFELAKTKNKELYDLLTGNMPQAIKDRFGIDIREDKKFTQADTTTFEGITSKNMFHSKMHFYKSVNANKNGMAYIINENVEKITSMFSGKFATLKGSTQLQQTLQQVGKKNPMAYFIWYQNNKIDLAQFYDEVKRGVKSVSEAEKQVSNYITEIQDIQTFISDYYM